MSVSLGAFMRSSVHQMVGIILRQHPTPQHHTTLQTFVWFMWSAFANPYFVHSTCFTQRSVNKCAHSKGRIIELARHTLSLSLPRIRTALHRFSLLLLWKRNENVHSFRNNSSFDQHFESIEHFDVCLIYICSHVHRVLGIFFHYPSMVLSVNTLAWLHCGGAQKYSIGQWI